MSTELNITIDQGATWEKSISWQDSNEDPYDLTLYTARMQIRKKYADQDKGLPLLSLTDDPPSTGDADGGGIVLDDATPNIVITITDTETAALPRGEYFYDLELESDAGLVTKLLRGKVFVLGEVTR